MYVKGPSAEPGTWQGLQPQMAPAISSCPGYPRVKHKHYTSFSTPPQRLPCQAQATLAIQPPTYHVCLGKPLSLPSISFSIHVVRLLGLDELKDTLLPSKSQGSEVPPISTTP